MMWTLTRQLDNYCRMAHWVPTAMVLAGTLLCGPAAAQEDGEPAPTEEGTDTADIPNRGPLHQPYLGARLRLEYDYRAHGSETDSDFYGRLYVTGRDLMDGRVDGYLSGRLYSDLDSTSSNLSEDPFYSVDDSNGVTEDRLLQAYVDVHDQDNRFSLRAGRQYVEIADYLQLDGAQLTILENRELGGRIYGGQPVSYYTGVSDDYALGLSLLGKPWDGNYSRITYSRYHDESEEAADNNYYLDLRQQLADTSRARGQISVLNEDFRMGRADWYFYTPDGATDMALGASYWGSFDAKTRVYSPLYRVLGDQDPYAQVYGRITQELVPSWYLSPGLSLRFADSTSETEYSNRDYENYDLTLIFEPDRSFSTSIALEYWTVDHDDSFLGVSGDVRYRHGRVWEVSGGASFSEYTYDTYSDITYATTGGSTVFTEGGTIIEQSPYVYTYYVRGKWRVTRWLRARLQFDIEDNDEFSDLAYRARGSLEVRY